MARSSSIDTASTAESEDNIDIGAGLSPSMISTDISTINGWDYDTIMYVKKIGDLAGAYNWIHNNTAFWFSMINYFLHFLILIFKAQTFASVLATIAEEVDTFYVKIIIASIVAIGFIIKGIHVGLKLPDRISDRRASAARYSTIFTKVRNELIKNDEFRREASDFIEEIEKEFEEYYNASPPVWSIVSRRYLLMIKGKTDLKYSELSGIREIKIRRRKKKIRKQVRSTPRVVESDEDSHHSSSEENGPAPSKRDVMSRVMTMFDMNIFTMNKAQKQYEMDRHFIDV